uniref:Uncharacterized protein n=1 Tax=Aegilops tauschii TaxID=37682 RepID=M8BWJ1_AEGTA
MGSSSTTLKSVVATNGVPMTFAIHDYSMLWLMPPGSPATLIQIINFGHHRWHVKACPSDFITGVPNSVTLCIFTTLKYYLQQSPEDTNIAIEILDHTCEHTIFHKEQTLGECPMFVPLVLERSELEAAACVHAKDYILVRCTMKFTGGKRTPDNKSKWWCLLGRTVASFPI